MGRCERILCENGSAQAACRHDRKIACGKVRNNKHTMKQPTAQVPRNQRGNSESPACDHGYRLLRRIACGLELTVLELTGHVVSPRSGCLFSEDIARIAKQKTISLFGLITDPSAAKDIASTPRCMPNDFSRAHLSE